MWLERILEMGEFYGKKIIAIKLIKKKKDDYLLSTY